MAGTKTGGRMHYTTPEAEDARWQIAQKVAALLERRDELEADCDDARALSELTVIEMELRKLQAQMRALDEVPA